MSGGAFLGLILLSMAWLFFLVGLAANYRLLHPQVRLGFLPWPWLWILLPLALDPGCVGWIVLRLRQKR